MNYQPAHLAALLPVAYLVGSVPCGFLLARAVGIDLRQTGSGNIGATNVFRCAGKTLGIIAFVLDALKGFLPAFCLPALYVSSAPPAPVWLGLACGVAAVPGHNWPVWLGFKGGKGVSTSAGMLLGVAPAAVGIGFAVFVPVVILTRWVSLSSMLAALAVAASGFAFYRASNPILVAALCLLALLVVWRHRANIRRLLDGTEPRIVPRKKD